MHKKSLPIAMKVCMMEEMLVFKQEETSNDS